MRARAGQGRRRCVVMCVCVDACWECGSAVSGGVVEQHVVGVVREACEGVRVECGLLDEGEGEDAPLAAGWEHGSLMLFCM